MDNAKPKKGKGNHGEKLTDAEFIKLSKYVDGFNTKTEPANNLGIDRMVLWRILKTETASRENIIKIRESLQNINSNDLYEHSAE